jgi:hypothetical protein
MIIVTTVLTLLVFTLAIISCHLLLKKARFDINAGLYDEELAQRKEEKKKDSKWKSFLCYLFSIIIFVGLAFILVSAIIYRANGEQVKFGDKTVLVIASDSMNGYYDDKYKNELTVLKSDSQKDQFATGDILSFTTVGENDDLELYSVYAYKNSKGELIVHRYIGNNSDGKYYFRGDNTAGRDTSVNRNQIVYKYTGSKVVYLGNFILFSKSYYGLYSLCSILLAYIIYVIYQSRLKKLINYRYNASILTATVSQIAAEERARVLVEDPTMKVKDEFEFDRNRRAIIYEKDSEEHN